MLARMATTGIDVAIAAYGVLDEVEQAEAFSRIREARLLASVGTDSETARFIAGLKRVAEFAGRTPTIDDYRQIRRMLKEAGEDVPEANQVIRYFGSWRSAKEALELGQETTAERIDARFRLRRLGKVGRYRDETLRDTLARCAEYLGRPPLVVEFETWRSRELELAKARGEDNAHLPSTSPFRNRFGTWERALIHFGYSEEAIAGRLEPGRARSSEALRLHQFGGNARDRPN